MIEGHARRQPAVVADHAARADHAVGTETHPRTDARARLDHHTGTDRSARIDAGILGDYRTRVDAGRGNRLAVEQMRELGKRQVGVGQHQGIAGIVLRVRRSQQHRTGPAVGQVLAVLGVGQEGQLLRTGVLQRGQPADWQVGRTTQFGAGTLGQFAQGKYASTHGISATGSCARSPAW
ncbi:hypothetical protein D3C78_1375180 [compost metagenome]